MTLVRDQAALRVRRWGTNAATKLTPEADGLDRANGFPDSYGVDTFWDLGVVNIQLEELYASIVELQESGGLLPWHGGQQYRHRAYVAGSDGIAYESVQDSINQNPVGDASRTYWRPFIRLTEAADAATVELGASTTEFVSPGRLLQGLFKNNVANRWRALTNRFGLVRRATALEVANRSGDGYVRAADLPSDTVVQPATTTTRGTSRRATESEADTGTAREPHMTPHLVERRVATRAALAGATFTGDTNVPLPGVNDNSRKAAPTEWVRARLEEIGTVGDTLWAGNIAITATWTIVNLAASLDDYDGIYVLFGDYTPSPDRDQSVIADVPNLAPHDANEFKSSLEAIGSSGTEAPATRQVENNRRALSFRLPGGVASTNTGQLHRVIGIKYGTPS